MANCLLCNSLKEKNKTLIKKFKYWSLFLSFNQHGLGTTFIVINHHIERLNKVTKEEFNNLYLVMKKLENSLDKTFKPDKINYLMMANTVHHVHFQVIPRYKEKRVFAGKEWKDEKWGHRPVLTHDKEDDKVLNQIKKTISNNL